MVEMATTEKLAQALTEARAPQLLIDRARVGYYDDFKSHLPEPITTLILDAIVEGLYDIAERAKNGEFDASFEESEAAIKAYLGGQWIV